MPRFNGIPVDDAEPVKGGRFGGIPVDPEPPASTGEDRGALAFLNRGIANTLGAPVDLVNAGIRAVGLPASETPFGGSELIGRGLDRIGARVAPSSANPETFGEYVGMGVGGAAGAMLPGAGIVAGAARSASPLAQGAAQAVSRPYIATPGRALASEVAAGAGAGVGMSVANEVAPDSGTAEVIGALAGGIAGGVGPGLAVRGVQSTPVIGTGLRVAQREIAPFTEAGAMERARSRVGGLVEDREAALRNLDGENIGGLSPAVQTGDRRLMGLEQSVRDQVPSADLAMREAETAAAEILRGEMMAPAAGVGADATRRFASERVGGLVGRMNDRITQAEQRARERVSALNPSQSQAQASIIVRDELDNALTSARAQERELWGAVPREALVPTQTARQTYRAILEDMPRAQRDDMPARAREFLEEAGNQSFRPEETVREVHGLYSSLRETARNARSGDTPNRNQARIADMLADSILDDMNTVSGAMAPLREALDFSRELNQTFSRGSVGRVLGSERTGGDRVADIQTLDRTVGRPGRSGAVALDEVQRAVGDSPPTQAAVQDYMRGRFQDAAVRDGQLRGAPAESFLTSNRDVLARMPETEQGIADAVRASEVANRTRERMMTRADNVERRSAASTLTGARPGEEIEAILRSGNPRQTAAELARQARRDQSGEAARGLKGAFLGRLMQQATRSDFDEAGSAMISGRNLKRQMADQRVSAVGEEILTQGERDRLARIADEFARLETMQGRLPSAGSVMGDEPNSIVSYFARVLAARSGAQMGQGTSGASLQTAQMASRRMQRVLERLTNDRAEALIIKAVTEDQDLFRTLLTPGSAVTRRQEDRLIEAMSGITGNQISTADLAGRRDNETQTGAIRRIEAARDNGDITSAQAREAVQMVVRSN